MIITDFEQTNDTFLMYLIFPKKIEIIMDF